MVSTTRVLSRPGPLASVSSLPMFVSDLRHFLDIPDDAPVRLGE